ncbi:GNAT family N-acetyltransferase [Aeromicrobium sp. YIM 150415]|uniref:GNAT family N-acetyltransferase n=1 Tax=Aeromicrobium sp. YIM 150415 TaxID=2803912 RepID=UPI001965216A|nr:GNAT family N-acetyltransferase [Aeromicrobium sp. YIM 150415]MBM9461863.1 GNAT family N-acetyltransferase [Aeromicrobium sp. YIM 150415]
MVEVREFRQSDWPIVWAIIHDVVSAADTFPYDPAMSERQARETWLFSPPGLTVVAVDADRVVGTAALGPNRPGPGSHISTGSFMVAAESRNRGVGRALGEYALAWARREGYAAMQFNAVVETNTAAIRLYERLGFVTLCTVPGAFEHPSRGRVGLNLMLCDLSSAPVQSISATTE